MIPTRFFSYYVGVDLGQRQDYTAVAIIEEPVFVDGRALDPDEDPRGWAWLAGLQEPGWASPASLPPAALGKARADNYHRGRPADVPLSLRHLERLPLDTPYPQQVERVRTLLATPPLAGRPSALVVDATGVGVGVVDLFAAAGLDPVAVSIHGGDKTAHEQVRHGSEAPQQAPGAETGPRGAVQVLLQNERLKIARRLPEAETLRRELQNFRVKVDPKTAHDSYSHWREAEHDDLVLATALAAWFRRYRNKHVDATYAEIEKDPSMSEFKIDPERYRGMSPEDAARQMAEDEREFINSHPAVVEALQRIEDREREEEAEELRGAREARRQREQEAEVRWEEERMRQRRLWVAGGGAESEFDSVWPEMKRQMLMERVSGAEERRKRAAFAGFKF